MSKFYVGAEGPLDAELAIVAEKPAWSEVHKKRPLIGKSGQYLREHLFAANAPNPATKYWDEVNKEWAFLNDSRIYYTNAVQHFDDPDANPTLGQLFSEKEHIRLIRELSQLPRLKAIIVLGNWGLAALGNFAYSKLDRKTKAPTGIMKWRGSVIPSIIPSHYEGVDWVKMIPTLHPSFYFNDWRFKGIVQFDINRAVEQLAFPDRRYLEREFYIRPSNLDEVISWFDEWERDLDSGKYDVTLKNGKVVRCLCFDLEAMKGRYDSRYICCINIAITPTKGYCIPITYNNRKPYFSISNEVVIWKRLQQLLQRKDLTLITQNGCPFDIPLIRKHSIVIPDIVLKQSFDTMHAHSLLAADLPHDQGFLTSIYTNDEYYKDQSGDWDTSQINFVRSDEDTFWQYGCKDSCTELENAYGLMNDLIEAS